jgi:hypothetical protein
MERQVPAFVILADEDSKQQRLFRDLHRRAP